MKNSKKGIEDNEAIAQLVQWSKIEISSQNVLDFKDFNIFSATSVHYKNKFFLFNAHVDETKLNQLISYIKPTF